MNKDPQVIPVVKWVGGKRQLLSELSSFMPPSFSTYYEPFLGGGAVLFFLQPRKAVVNDVNAELINVYITIRDNVDALVSELQGYRNEVDYFYHIRALDRNKELYKNLSAVQRAARIIYLNKTCYNGLFRVNKRGQFNAPFGKYDNPNIVNEETLRAVSRYFNDCDIVFQCADFGEAIQGVEPTGFVYLDPPYVPVSESAHFTSYDKSGFGAKEQVRLKECCDQLHKKGVHFLLSNSATDLIMELYSQYRIELVKAKRTVNSKGDRRGAVDEVLVMNY